MINNNNLRELILSLLHDIIIETLRDENVRVYLFGSWARKEEKRSSDIDIAIEVFDQLSSSKWTELIDKVEESTIPYNVDIVNLKDASTTLVNNVKREGILWKDFKTD